MAKKTLNVRALMEVGWGTIPDYPGGLNLPHGPLEAENLSNICSEEDVTQKNTLRDTLFLVLKMEEGGRRPQAKEYGLPLEAEQEKGFSLRASKKECSFDDAFILVWQNPC